MANASQAQIKSLSGQISKLKITKAKHILMIILAMFISTIGARYFVVYANIFSTGITGLSQGIVYTTLDVLDVKENNYDLYITLKNTTYYLVSIFFNIFIAAFAIKKFGKEYTYWSIFAFVLAIGLSFFFNYVPGFKDVEFIPGYQFIYNSGDWEYYLEHTGDGVAAADEMALAWVAIGTTFAVTIVAGTIGGALMGAAGGLVYKTGSGQLSLDPVSKYLNKYTRIPGKRFTFLFALTNAFVWVLIAECLKGNVGTFADFVVVLFHPRIIGTMIFLLTYYFVLGVVHPANKKVIVEVNSGKANEISEHLNVTGYHRPHSIFTVKGGRTKQERQIIQMVIMSEEMFDFVNQIAAIDDKAFIISTEADGIYGNFNSKLRYHGPNDNNHHTTSTQEMKLPFYKKWWKKLHVKSDKSFNAGASSADITKNDTMLSAKEVESIKQEVKAAEKASGEKLTEAEKQFIVESEKHLQQEAKDADVKAAQVHQELNEKK